MNLEMKGMLVKKLEAQKGVTKAGKEWVKQSFVLDNGAKYNSEICFNLFGQDKVDMLDQYYEGDNIEVLFNLSSREYKGNYYTSADVWKMKRNVDVSEQQALHDELDSNNGLPF